jgi:single-stranded DNA-binding protein
LANAKTEWHRVAWNGLGEYAAAKLRKGDHIYVEGMLVSSTYQKEYGKNKITVPLSLRVYGSGQVAQDVSVTWSFRLRLSLRMESAFTCQAL